ncbi:molybdenum cofactor guanylyltransferase MobA [Macrococcoides canis]|uniref:molybdenum cofactor guanylyltransferase MobA n=1 Tax=Macrococcoides canis TaxID=1855823 RepID=UPI0020B7AE7E|nr:molybdenum cofactor guanylyltransferase MobA [Macrococcus canis]UTH07046.1 molybdenum cofactor guanylyltransferase MobA [Macrococcus canis]
MIGVILSGGHSTRFGTNKAVYEIDGKPFFEHVYDAFKKSNVERIVLSTNDQMASYFEEMINDKQLDMQVVTDSVVDCGPIGGIYEVMSSYDADSYFIVSVDTPFITAEAIDHLVGGFHEHDTNAICYMDSEQVHRTIAIYRRALLPLIEEGINHTRYALKQLTQDAVFIHVSEVSSHAQWYANINTQEDLQNVRRVTNGTNNR